VTSSPSSTPRQQLPGPPGTLIARAAHGPSTLPPEAGGAAAPATHRRDPPLLHIDDAEVGGAKGEGLLAIARG
jgi:hypothetical protein